MSMENANTRLGLDVGSNSIGWALLGLDEEKKPCRIIASGVRIFSDGRDAKTKATLAAERRLVRSMRRNRDRYLQRRKALMNRLIRFGLMPKSEDERKELVPLDPYKLRSRALHGPLPAHHIGRALFHLNQRRGFKSNRKTDREETGVVSGSVAELKQRMEKGGHPTLGAYLRDLRQKGNSVRARRHGTKKADLYDNYPDRAMLEDEYEQIWDAQKEYHPELLHDDARDSIRHAIFDQRPLKAPIIGKCRYLPENQRAARALPSFQLFRTLQELNNLQWRPAYERQEQRFFDSPEAYKDTLDKLKRKGKLTNGDIKKLQRSLSREDIRCNIELTKIKGDQTAVNLAGKKGMGPRWHEWPLEQQNRFVELLLGDDVTDEEALEKMQQDYGLDLETAQRCLRTNLEEGHSPICKEAIDKMLPSLKEGLLYNEARDAAGFSDAWDEGEMLASLPPYPEILQDHAVERTLPDGTVDCRIPNPTVHIALNQIRKVVNELTRIHGRPAQTVIELARDLPLGAEGKKEIEKNQKQNRDRNEEINQRLEESESESGHLPNHLNRTLVKLWEELDWENINNRHCPYTGKQISWSMLFTPEIEIDHILPYSRTLDDGMMNKTVCFRKANREKGERSPFEAFGDKPEYEEILQRSSRFPWRRGERFLEGAMEKFEGEEGFLARQLNDTRYISRLALRYLKAICPDTWVVTGRHTALLRHEWGLGSILKELREKDSSPTIAGSDDGPQGEENDSNLAEGSTNTEGRGKSQGEKNREDHRHHAVDAITVALTGRSALQLISEANVEANDLGLQKLVSSLPPPWKGLRDDARASIKRIVVSHKKRGKKEGALHRDTAYRVEEGRNGEPLKLVHRMPVDAIKSRDDIKRIVDPRLREDLIERVTDLPEKGISSAVADYAKGKITRRIRVRKTSSENSIVRIRDGQDNTYKAYEAQGNWAYVIYEGEKRDSKGEKRWSGEIIRTFDANQKGGMDRWRKKNQDKAIIMWLQANDMLGWYERGEYRIFRVQTITLGSISLSEHFNANVDARARRARKDRKEKGVKKEENVLFSIVPETLRQKEQPCKVHVSPAGRVSILHTKF